MEKISSGVIFWFETVMRTTGKNKISHNNGFDKNITPEFIVSIPLNYFCVYLFYV